MAAGGVRLTICRRGLHSDWVEEKAASIRFFLVDVFRCFLIVTQPRTRSRSNLLLWPKTRFTSGIFEGVASDIAATQLLPGYLWRDALGPLFLPPIVVTFLLLDRFRSRTPIPLTASKGFMAGEWTDDDSRPSCLRGQTCPRCLYCRIQFGYPTFASDRPNPRYVQPPLSEENMG
jgi:hypothetical protein